jgi:hypothetical protein
MHIGNQSLTETLNVSFDTPVYQVKVDFFGLNNDGTHSEKLSLKINGADLVLNVAKLSSLTIGGETQYASQIVSNFIVPSNSFASGGTYTIESTTGINSLELKDNVLTGSPNGVGAAISISSATLQASGGVAISSLMPAATDADGSVVGYAITSAATETGADTTPGSWQYLNGSTWTSLASASVSQAVFLTAGTLVRWNDNDSDYTALSAVAVDNTVVATLGQALNVTTRGLGTGFSSDIATLATTVAPVVLDLNRDGQISYSSVTMDVNGDGQLDLTAWAGAQDGVLVWDKYRDSLVHDNSQYAFAQYATTYANGLDANGKAPTDLSGLAEAFDSNRDGVFDAQDAQFADFKVWQDANQNGVSDAGEVRSLADWGIASINLVSDGVVRTPAVGVIEAGRTTATATDGSSVLVSDAGFEYQSLAYSAETVAGLGAHIDLLGVGLNLDFASLASVHDGIGLVDLSGAGANSLKVTLSDVLQGTLSGRLQLTGDADDTLVFQAEEWQHAGQQVVDNGHVYDVYAAAHGLTAQLWIDQMLNRHLL